MGPNYIGTISAMTLVGHRYIGHNYMAIAVTMPPEVLQTGLMLRYLRLDINPMLGPLRLSMYEVRATATSADAKDCIRGTRHRIDDGSLEQATAILAARRLGIGHPSSRGYRRLVVGANNGHPRS